MSKTDCSVTNSKMKSILEEFASEQTVEFQALQYEYEERITHMQAVHAAELLHEQNRCVEFENLFLQS